MTLSKVLGKFIPAVKTDPVVLTRALLGVDALLSEIKFPNMLEEDVKELRRSIYSLLDNMEDVEEGYRLYGVGLKLAQLAADGYKDYPVLEVVARNQKKSYFRHLIDISEGADIPTTTKALLSWATHLTIEEEISGKDYSDEILAILRLVELTRSTGDTEVATNYIRSLFLPW